MDWLASLKNLSDPHARRKKLSFLVNVLRLSRMRYTIPRRDAPLVVISLTEHLGDIVACEPVARYVRSQYPDARILWVTRRPYDQLFAAHPAIDGCLTVFCLTEWIWLKRCGFFDRIIDLHLRNRICRYCKVPLPKPAEAPIVDGSNYLRVGGLLNAFSLGAGLPRLDEAPRLFIPEVAVKEVDVLSLPPRFIVAHATALDADKHWPTTKWAALAARIHETCRLPIVEVGLRPVLPAAPGVINLCGRLPIMATAEVIRRAALFIGIDSGPAHLANAAGTPGVILLGRYSYFDRYNPFSGNYAEDRDCVILQANGPAANLSVDAVCHAAFARLGSA